MSGEHGSRVGAAMGSHSTKSGARSKFGWATSGRYLRTIRSFRQTTDIVRSGENADIIDVARLLAINDEAEAIVSESRDLRSVRTSSISSRSAQLAQVLQESNRPLKLR